MTSAEATNVGVVRKYFDGCNTGELTDLMATLTPDVVHYFLPDRFPPIISRGTGGRTSEHSIRFGPLTTQSRRVTKSSANGVASGRRKGRIAA
jgi:ketosteroid isomerase-like protein